MPTDYYDDQVHYGKTTYEGEVVFGETPPEISLDNLASLTGTGTCTFADLAATDDLTVGDDATIGGDLAVTGATTCAALACTTLAPSGNVAVATNKFTIAAASGNTAIAGTLAVTGATTCAALTSSGQIQAADLVATDDLTVGDDASVGGDLAVTGTATVTNLEVGAGSVDLSAVMTLTMPNGFTEVKTYTSSELNISLSGVATETFDLPGPESAIILGAVITTMGAVSSSNGSTTGLAAEVGIASDPDFLLQSLSVFGAVGKKQSISGVGMGGYRAADTFQLKLTATGGAPDVAHIEGFGAYVTIFYIEIDV